MQTAEESVRDISGILVGCANQKVPIFFEFVSRMRIITFMKEVRINPKRTIIHSRFTVVMSELNERYSLDEILLDLIEWLKVGDVVSRFVLDRRCLRLLVFFLMMRNDRPKRSDCPLSNS